jgi:hypothetical protein
VASIHLKRNLALLWVDTLWACHDVIISFFIKNLNKKSLLDMDNQAKLCIDCDVVVESVGVSLAHAADSMSK